ncbi:MAG: 16S rRNA (guanine(527)-N(7))-methyltransferase RsmG [Thermoguttaceae bacterium]|nr:16S rRNA (guanine(527)-N(7))-methyltransferase RsmG [Thermoguttaceae bacterium]MBR0191233.1 16S rRNA (guanine(527)-N(7))-methyltransferase RsmG [Thermoguttaceae bacterium]
MSDEIELNPEETQNETLENSQEETKRPAPVTDAPSLETLKATLAKYGIEISEPQIELLEKFCELEWDWNTKINLTRHTTYEKFVTRDLVDTLAFSEFLAPDEKVLDVGSGNGVPGILLGILRPDVSISLVECVAKKAKVLAEIIHELQLPIPVYCALGQDILGNWQFHTLTFRAVASMRKILEWFKPCWPHFDRMLLVKGPKWTVERGEARHYSLMHGLALRKLKEYTTPGSDEVKLSTDELSAEEAEKPDRAENPTEQENGAKSVILQICPEEKIGKGNLCVLSSLETSKSRNKFDHDKRRKSRVVEETVEYVDAADFAGLDEDGDQVSIRKHAPRKPFGSKSDRADRPGRADRGRGEKGKRSASSRGRSKRSESSERPDHEPGFGGRGGGLESGFRSERKKIHGPKKFKRGSEE